jgi:hypothetical protein
MVPSNSDSILLVSPEKEYKLSPVKDLASSSNTAREIERWKNALEFAISRANKFDAKVTGGWLTKRGGKGHKVQNTKRRYFVLRGNLLQYYSEPKEKTNDISTLKGYMDIAKIVDLEIVTGGNPTDYRFRVVSNDYKEFILQAKDESDRNRWIEAVDRQIKLLEDHEFQVSYNLQETVLKNGKLNRADLFPKPASAVSNFVCLTQVSLRFYPNNADINSVTKDIAKDVSLVVPLLGAYCGLDNQTNRILVVDSMGNSYSIYAKDREVNKQWEADIQAGIVAIAKQHVSLGSNLRFSCFIQQQVNGPEESAIIIVNDEGVCIEMLQSKQQLRVDMSMFVGLAFANAEAFMLKYYAKGVPHTDELPPTSITIRTTNAAGIYSMVGAAVEGLRGGDNIISRKRFNTKPDPNKKGTKKKKRAIGGKKKTTSLVSSRPSGQLNIPDSGPAPPSMMLPSDFDQVMANRKSVLPKMTAATAAALPPGTLSNSSRSVVLPSDIPILVSERVDYGSEDEESDDETSASTPPVSPGAQPTSSYTMTKPPPGPIPVPGGLLIPQNVELTTQSVRMSVSPGLMQALTAQAEAETASPREPEHAGSTSSLAPIPIPSGLMALPPPPPPEDYDVDHDDDDDSDDDSSEEASIEEEESPFGDYPVPGDSEVQPADVEHYGRARVESYVPPPPPEDEDE